MTMMKVGLVLIGVSSVFGYIGTHNPHEKFGIVCLVVGLIGFVLGAGISAAGFGEKHNL